MYYFKSFKPADDGKHKYEIIFENPENRRTKTVKFGAHGMMDYTLYYKKDGKKIADEHRDNYIKRHKVNEIWDNPYLPGTLSRYILWEHKSVKESLVDYIKRFHLHKSS